MAIVKEYSRPLADAGRLDAVQSVTTSTAVILRNYGISRITQAGAAKTYELADPISGLNKTVLIDSATAAVGMAIVGGGDFVSAPAVGGDLASSSGTTGLTRSVVLVGLSTADWGVVSASTGITFS